MPIYLTAIIRVKAEYHAAIRTLLEDMVYQTRKEEANIQYNLHQSIDQETTYVFYEIWKDQKGFDLHNTQPYIRSFQQIVAEKLQSAPELYLTQKI